MQKIQTNSRTGMKTALFGFVILGLLAAVLTRGYSAPLNRPLTTVILVRHAEKKTDEPNNKDPDLSPAGVTRAQEIARMFGASGITAIYVTQYKRTQQTVKPLADKLGIAVTQVEAKKSADVVDQIRSQHTGGLVFVAGHNNTVPEIIHGLGGPKLPIIPETEFDNLYVLTIAPDGKVDLLTLKYGSALAGPPPVPGTKMMQ
jgi:broad specificity phosphatase PhoE